MAPKIGQGNSKIPDRGYELFITATVMVIVAGMFTAARIATRLTNKQFGIDDYAIMLSIVSALLLWRIVTDFMGYTDTFRRFRYA